MVNNIPICFVKVCLSRYQVAKLNLRYYDQRFDWKAILIISVHFTLERV